MANDKQRMAHNPEKTQNQIDSGSDGMRDDRSNGNPEVGTHTPGKHLRSDTVRHSENQDENGVKQTHENRENPEQDHVPGHMGYSREDVRGINPTDRE